MGDHLVDPLICLKVMVLSSLIKCTPIFLWLAAAANDITYNNTLSTFYSQFSILASCL